MGSTKEIQTRMKSIQDTMKITNAMYMISSSKMQKAKRILSDTEPYYLQYAGSNFHESCVICRIQSILFSVSVIRFAEEDRKIGCIVVTGDKVWQVPITIISRK